MYGKLLVNHRVLCSSTKGLIEKAERYEAQISELINENQTLKIRAGVAWEEMTPRPSLEKVNKIMNNCFFINLCFFYLSFKKF